jgi:Oxidoreductase family, C-terminal alpha/beta domain/Oxidoreductase family, NAD-binding Rossmann fold
MKRKRFLDRREFVKTTAAASVAFTIIPRNVLGGKGFIAPSDKINLAYIGCGTQGLAEMCELITDSAIQIVSVCDPNKFSTDYIDWNATRIKGAIQKLFGKPDWGVNYNGIPGGRDIGKEVVDTYYSMQAGNTYKSCSTYIDFRELLERQKDFDAVKIMTPDHLHGYISVAAMKKGKHVVIHKPLANRMYEARKVMDTAKQTGMSTHLLAWSKRSGNTLVKQWIDEGRIGTLKEIHNWSNRPVWPQWIANPKETPPVPNDFNWDLWLGPVPERPYHPNYTHNVFRGWYDFGAGAIADMGHYSLWPMFLQLGINTAPLSAEAYGTTTRIVENGISRPYNNDVAFPVSCIIRFKFPKQEALPAFDLYWYDGGMKPNAPDELEGKPLEAEGMMFVGDKGKIIAGFRTENPRLIPDSKMKTYMEGKESYKEEIEGGGPHWINAFKNKTESPGSFLNAGAVTETILLGAVALRARKKVEYDSAAMKITNDEAANKFFNREYRQGWGM